MSIVHPLKIVVYLFIKLAAIQSPIIRQLFHVVSNIFHSSKSQEKDTQSEMSNISSTVTKC